MGWPVLGYLLGKNYRRRDRDHLVPPRRLDAAICRAEVCYPFGREHGRYRAVRRREFITLLGGAAAWPLAARAQQLKVAQIGVLVLTNADGQSLTRELRLGLRDLGYSEGRNFIFQLRSADGDAGRLPQLATELMSSQVDVVVATFTPCALAAKQATATIPIVMAAVADPIAVGLVTSLARPGSNVTGFSNMAAETAAKSVELFRDMLPSIGRVAALANPADPFTTPFVEQVRLAGRSAGIRIEPVAMARGPEEAEAAFATISQEGAEAVVVQGIFFSKTITELALKYRLPTASVVRQFAEAGGLISYGAGIRDIYRRSATLVHKILQGTKPSDLPVELPTRFELVLNMKTAKALGIDVPWFFQVHGVDAEGATVLRKQLRRAQVLAFFSRLPPCLVGLEACATAHYWARELRALGHEVRLMPAQYVKAYIKRNKHDAADAEAICEAVGRPTMRFVPVKTADQQAAVLLHRGRERLVRQRTGLVNALRGHLAEFGVIAPQGLRNVGKLIAIVRDDADIRLPPVAQQVLQVLASQLEQIEAAVAALERQLLTWHKTNPVRQRLASIPGIGPIIATAIATTVADANEFRSGREFAAWLGLVPRQNSTGGKIRLGGITKRGNRYLRRLLINGASANLLRSKATNADPWVIGLRRRRPSLVVAVALANKTARIAWAVMLREKEYQPRAMAA